MGKYETATLSIGVRILLKDVFEMMNEDNYQEFDDTFIGYGVMIEDENNDYNLTFSRITDGDDPKTEEHADLDDMENSAQIEWYTKMFKLYGSGCYLRGGGYKVDTYNEDENSPHNLYNQYLLVPFNQILSTDRWGYDREGTNGSSCELNVEDLSEDAKNIHKKMEELGIDSDKYKVVMTLHQSSY
jgi:hypothetical protein